MSEISIILFEVVHADLNGVKLEYDARSELVGGWQSHSGAVTGSTPRVQYGHHDALSAPLNTLRRTSMTMPSGKIVGYEFGSMEDIAFDIDWRLGRINRLGYRTGTVTTPELAFTYAGVAMPVRMEYPAATLQWSLLPQADDADPQGQMPPASNPYPAIDRFGRLLKARWLTTEATPSIRAQVNYTYDRASRRTVRTVPNAQAGNEETETYGYDGLSQVTQRKRGAAVYENGTFMGVTTPPRRQEDFTYDTLGNWQRYHARGIVYNPSTTLSNFDTLLDQTRNHNGANQITGFSNSPRPVTHDAAGNCTESSPVQNTGTIEWSTSHRYQWDEWNRLLRITHSGTGAEIARHAYDGLTRRTTLQEGGSSMPVRHFYYNDQWRSVEETLDSAPITQPERRHLFNPLNRWHLIHRFRNTPTIENLYCLHDAMDPIAITNATGQVLERYNYSAFGMRRVMEENFNEKSQSLTDYAWNWEFHGEFSDEASGLHNYGWRYYNSTLGVWLNRDPIEETGGINTQCFSWNNSINSSDFIGLSPSQLEKAEGETSKASTTVTSKFCCGPDISKALDKTNEAIEAAWNTSSVDDRKGICSAYRNSKGWDIQNLQTKTDRISLPKWDVDCGEQDPSNAPQCSQTVTIHQQCYYRGDVNYFLWGKMAQLCDQQLVDNIQYLRLWKLFKYGEFSNPAAESWTFAGYFGFETGGERVARIVPPKHPQMRAPWTPHLRPQSRPKGGYDPILLPRETRPNCSPCDKEHSSILN